MDTEFGGLPRGRAGDVVRGRMVAPPVWRLPGAISGWAIAAGGGLQGGEGGGGGGGERERERRVFVELAAAFAGL